LTRTSREALSQARDLATGLGQLEADGEHLLLVLLDQADTVVPRLLTGLGVDVALLRVEVDADLRHRPKVTEPGAARSPVHLTRRLSGVLQVAEREADRLHDREVSVAHLVLGLAEEGSGTGAGRRLTERGVTPAAFLAALGQVRGTGG